MRQLAQGYRARQVKLILESSILQLLLDVALFFSVYISAAAQLKHIPPTVSVNACFGCLYVLTVSQVLFIFSTRCALTLHSAHLFLPVFSCSSPSQCTVKGTEH